jgi:1-deoxy-D-xylulose-5-phosphate synthase
VGRTGARENGFGSAPVEAANAAGLDTRNLVRLGISDCFIEHVERSELQAELRSEVDDICRTA